MNPEPHHCTEPDCPYDGQPSTPGCGCHKTDRQVLEERAVAAEQQVTYLRDALHLARQHCMGQGWHGGIAYDLRTWIDAGMDGPAPRGRAAARQDEPPPAIEAPAPADPDLAPFNLPPSALAIARAFDQRIREDVNETFFELWEAMVADPQAPRKAGSVVAHLTIGCAARYALFGAQCAGVEPRRDLWEQLTADHFDRAKAVLSDARNEAESRETSHGARR